MFFRGRARSCQHNLPRAGAGAGTDMLSGSRVRAGAVENLPVAGLGAGARPFFFLELRLEPLGVILLGARVGAGAIVFFLQLIHIILIT